MKNFISLAIAAQIIFLSPAAIAQYGPPTRPYPYGGGAQYMVRPPPPPPPPWAHQRHHHGGNNTGAMVAAGGIGFALGLMLASSGIMNGGGYQQPMGPGPGPMGPQAVPVPVPVPQQQFAQTYANGFNQCMNQYQCGNQYAYPMQYQGNPANFYFRPGLQGPAVIGPNANGLPPWVRPGTMCRTFQNMIVDPQTGSVIRSVPVTGCQNPQTGGWDIMPNNMVTLGGQAQPWGPGYQQPYGPMQPQPVAMPQQQRPIIIQQVAPPPPPRPQVIVIPNNGYAGGGIQRPPAPPTLPPQGQMRILNPQPTGPALAPRPGVAQRPYVPNYGINRCPPGPGGQPPVTCPYPGAIR